MGYGGHGVEVCHMHVCGQNYNNHVIYKATIKRLTSKQFYGSNMIYINNQINAIQK